MRKRIYGSLKNPKYRKQLSLRLKALWKTKEFQLLMSEAAKRSGKLRTGENHPRWKGGSLRTWKKIALERDDYTCQDCGLRDPEIVVVDHDKCRRDYPELIRVLENLVTRCPNCHVRKSVRNKEYNSKKGN